MEATTVSYILVSTVSDFLELAGQAVSRGRKKVKQFTTQESLRLGVATALALDMALTTGISGQMEPVRRNFFLRTRI